MQVLYRKTQQTVNLGLHARFVYLLKPNQRKPYIWMKRKKVYSELAVRRRNPFASNHHLLVHGRVRNSKEQSGEGSTGDDAVPLP